MRSNAKQSNAKHRNAKQCKGKQCKAKQNNAKQSNAKQLGHCWSHEDDAGRWFLPPASSLCAPWCGVRFCDSSWHSCLVHSVGTCLIVGMLLLDEIFWSWIPFSLSRHALALHRCLRPGSHTQYKRRRLCMGYVLTCWQLDLGEEMCYPGWPVWQLLQMADLLAAVHLLTNFH